MSLEITSYQDQKDEKSTFNAFGALGIAAIIAFAVASPGNANSTNNTIKYLEQNGLTSISVDDAAFCNNKVGLHRKFTAIDAQGQAVEGQVCADKIETTPRKMRM